MIVKRFVRVYQTLLGVFFALLIAGIFGVLNNLRSELPIGNVIAWVLSIMAFLGIVATLIYGMIVQRINELALVVDDLVEKVATRNDTEKVVMEITDIVSLLRDAYSAATKDLVQAAQNLGLDMVYKERAQVEAELKNLLGHAKRTVKLLGICISMPTRVPNFSQVVQNKVEDGVTFKFLYLRRRPTDDIIDFYRQRADDEHYPAQLTDLKEDATRNIEALKEVRNRLSKNTKSSLKVREYQALPYLSMIVIDDEMFVGSYLFGETCPITPMYKIIRRDGGIFDTYNGHFERLWEASADALGEDIQGDPRTSEEVKTEPGNNANAADS